MKRFVVSEVWIRQYVVEAGSEADAYEAADPNISGAAAHARKAGLSLCNWHAIEVPAASLAKAEMK